MNLAWLLGFTSFLLGSCLFPITLGVWWKGATGFRSAASRLSRVLLCLGYFCHLVSLGLTVVGLVVLSVAGPVPVWRRQSRWKFRTIAAGAHFDQLRSAARARCISTCGRHAQAGRCGRSGKTVESWSPALGNGWAGSIRSHSRSRTAAVHQPGQPGVRRLRPGALALGGLVVIWWYGRITAEPRAGAERHPAMDRDRKKRSRRRRREPRDDRQGWLVLAALLLVGGIVGPDSFGAAHGEFLPQRVLLLGFIALVPVFDADSIAMVGPCAIAASLVAAVALQSAIVWDYATLFRRNGRADHPRRRCWSAETRRIVTLLVKSRGRFRANPLLHAENWLGVDTGNVVWNNYEALHYYFPVQFRPEIERPHPGRPGVVSIHEDPKDKADRLARLGRAFLPSTQIRST